MIIATAGHIDHGKTLLVKTLTGVDTDRLPEEKARGISIDIGFAYLPLAGGGLIGFVDVPGHERFVRNMLAGVCGIDFALLIVAADDGVMPQTVEHLHILDLLQVRRGAVALTKIDRVNDARVAEVRAAVNALLAPTALAGAPVLPVSAVAGTGIDGLRAHLVAEAARQTARGAADQNARLAIDRAFSVAGSGTVVTGTVFNGVIRPGDRLIVSPAGKEVRVRGIQVHGKAAHEVAAGNRCALNLTGAELDAVARGDWILAPAIHRPTQHVDARLSVLSAEGAPLRHWTPVHLHLATADVTARVGVPRGASIAPGASELVHLVLDKPIAALHGDRFIVRDQSATRTVGGGLVLDPFAPATRRRTTARASYLAALEEPTAEAALQSLLQAPDRSIDPAQFEALYNLLPDRAAKLFQAAGLTIIGKDTRVALTGTRLSALRDAVVARLAEFHRTSPQAVGFDVEQLRGTLAADLPAEVFGAILRGLADGRKIEVSGSVARLAGHNATANAADEKLWQTIRPVLDGAGFNAPPLRELAPQLNLKEAIVKDFLHRKAKGGEILKVTPDRFYPRATVATLAAIAQATAQAQPNGQFTAAQYRDWVGVGRGLAIEILEFLDTLGITQRIGDARKMRKDFVPILGPATAPPRPASTAAKPAPRPAQPPQRRPGPHPYRR